MALPYLAVAFAAVATVLGLGIDDTDHTRIFDVTQSDREWFRILHEEDGYILVGSGQIIYNVSLSDMSSTSISFELDDDGRRNCQLILRSYFRTHTNEVKCNNYVRTAFKEGDRFVFCGSNGGTARCRMLESNGTTASLSSPTYRLSSPPFAPPFPWMNFTLVKTSEGLLFTGGSMVDFQKRMLHAVYRNGSVDDALKPMLSNRWTETSVHALKTYVSDEPVDSRIYPNFVASFENAEHVYWVFSEAALESQPFQYVSTSRVARVCKNDMSHADDMVNDYSWGLDSFVTFWKATLECSVPGHYTPTGPFTYDNLGYNTFYFNTVAGSTVLHPGSVTPRREGQPPSSIMYAVFNTDRNSIRGSAVCAYSYESIVAPFSGPLYVLEASDTLLASSRSNAWTWSLVEFESPRNAHKHHPAKCANDTRLLRDVYPKQAMLADKVTPIKKRPLFVQTDHRYLMTHIVVDWQVRALDGRYYDILFIATDHGELLKMINIGTEEQMNFTIVENRTIVPSGQTPGEMRMIDSKPGERQRQLLVNTFDTVRLVALEKCSSYLSCHACVRLRDPYCSWSADQAKCVAIYDGSQPTGHYQNISEGLDPRCGPEFGGDEARERSLLATARSAAAAANEASVVVQQSLSSTEQQPSAASVATSVHADPVHASFNVVSTAAAVLPDPKSDSLLPVAPVRGESIDAQAAADTPERVTVNALVLACVGTGICCFILAFGLGWLARSKRKCSLDECLVPHLEHSVKDIADQQCPTKGEESHYSLLPTKSNNLTSNKLNNTLITQTEVVAALPKNKTKVEYV